METLLAYKANLKATAMDDMNALHFAAQKGHIDTSEILIQHGALQAHTTKMGDKWIVYLCSERLLSLKFGHSRWVYA